MSLDEPEKRRLRRLVILTACGLTVLGLSASVLMLKGSKAGAWPLLAGDLVLTLAVLGLAWRSLR